MRLRNLRLIRFGHFSDLELDFASGERHLHLVYGENEAGKSTALRAISGLLFGIPERTPDAHRHPAKDLRIGAELESDAGERLAMVRRKGRKDTLLSADESPIVEARLGAYLGGVPQELFEGMFGLDHERLIAGGRDLLAGRGELGEALFGAAAGLRGLHQLVEALERESGELFKATGQVPALNRALAEHREARKQIKQTALKPRDWQQVARARDEAREELERIRTEHARGKARLERRRLLKTTLPDLRGREVARARREELGDVVRLAEDAGDRRRSAEASLRNTDLRAQKLDDEKRRLESELTDLRIPDELLALGPRATDLNDRRAVYVKATHDRQDLLSKLDAGSSEVEALVRELPQSVPFKEIERLRVDAASQARIRELARQGERLEERATTLGESARAAAQRAEEAEQALASLAPERDATALRSVVGAARLEGDLESRRRQIGAEIARTRETARAAADALPFWTGSPEAAIELPLPADETLHRFEGHLSEAEEARRGLDDRKKEVRAEIDELHQKRAELESQGVIPSPDDLNESRGQRDGLWARVRRVWLEGRSDASTPEQLAGAYENAILQADGLGDRMFAEYERVARITNLAELERRCDENQARIERESEELSGRKARLTEAWAVAWAASKIEPATPREMRAWKAQHQGVVGLMEKLAGLRSEDETLGSSLEAHRSACLASLIALAGPQLEPNTSLSAILEAAEDRIRTVDRSREERGRRLDAVAAAKAARARSDRELEMTEREIEPWRQDWGATIALLNLPETARPSQAEAVLEKLDQIFAKHAQLTTFGERIRHIDADKRGFVLVLEALVQEGCPDLSEGEPQDRASELLARLQQGREDRTRRESLRARLADIEAELEGIGRERAAAHSEIELLIQAAHLSSADGLETAERRFNELHEVEKRLADIEERLLGTGIPLAELVSEAQHVVDTELIVEIEELEQSVEASERDRDLQNQKLAGLERDFEAMNGAGEAAQAAARAEEALAQIGNLTVEYAQKRMAAIVLAREIQRYAERNQGPILKRTSELFQRMTLERYAGISSGYSEDDQAVVLCHRADEETVGVEGLSDGTRDQLYLSLRLAALEQHMLHNESMPLIVDDVLVTFDDARSAATLKLMGELAAQTQVLFFTHHKRLVELAREGVPEDRLTVHELKGR